MYRWLLMLCCNITYCLFGIINHHNRNSLFALSFLVSQQGVIRISEKHKIFPCQKLHSSKKVTQHNFDQLYFYYLGFLFIKLDIPRKLVYLPFH